MLRERKGGGAIEKPVNGVEMRLKEWGRVGGSRDSAEPGETVEKLSLKMAIMKLNTSSANLKTKLNR